MEKTGAEMKLVSVKDWTSARSNVAREKCDDWDLQGTSLGSGDFAQAESGRRSQADLTVHGGAYKAVYCYPVAHYEYWRRSCRGRNC